MGLFNIQTIHKFRDLSSDFPGRPVSTRVFHNRTTNVDDRPGAPPRHPRLPLGPPLPILVQLVPLTCPVSCLLSPSTICQVMRKSEKSNPCKQKEFLPQTASLLPHGSCSRKRGQRGRFDLPPPISSGELVAWRCAAIKLVLKL